MAADALIEPNNFDVIVVGTGLQEAMLAAAAAASRLSVLHLDPNDFYGAHWTSLDFQQLSSWGADGGRFCALPAPPPAAPLSPKAGSATESLKNDAIGEESNGVPRRDEEERTERIELQFGAPVFSDFKVCDFHTASVGPSRTYSVDLCGPKLTFCGSNLVNLLLRSGASHYVEFKGVDATFLWTGTELSAVPASRADVFRDKSLSLSDKRHLMRFFKLVTDYATAEDATSAEILSGENLDGPFVHFLHRQRLPASIQSIVCYAIALVDEDQEQDVQDSGTLLKTRDGLRKLALYLFSVARFQNAPGAFIYPLYGQGELPQAFCRSAAVNGAIYVLRRPVNALLIDKDTKGYKGIQSQGQSLFSKKLILGPNIVPNTGNENNLSRLARLDAESPNRVYTATSAPTPQSEGSASQVARCICITDRSLSEGQNTLLVIFPPHSVHERSSNVIRALQLSSLASVCPENRYIVQLSITCKNADDGREGLEAAVQALFLCSENGNVELADADRGADTSSKPTLLWSLYYGQTLLTATENLRIPGIAVCELPDGTLHGESMLTRTEELFKEIFEGKAFFPERPAELEDTTQSMAENGHLQEPVVNDSMS